MKPTVKYNAESFLIIYITTSNLH